MAEGIKFNLKFDKSALKKLAQLNGRLGPALKRGVEGVLIDVSQRIQKEITKGAGGALRSRSGRLRRGWAPKGKEADYAVRLTGSTVRGHLGTRVKYGPIHNWGDTVTPQKAKWLTIPTKYAKTKAGVARKSARDYDNLRFVPLRGKYEGKLALLVEAFRWEKAGRSGGQVAGAARTERYERDGKKARRARAIFILKKAVNIPATYYVDWSVKEREPKAPGIVDHAIQEEINRVEAGR